MDFQKYNQIRFCSCLEWLTYKTDQFPVYEKKIMCVRFLNLKETSFLFTKSIHGLELNI